MNIRDVVKNTDSFRRSRPADGATRYYSIRLRSLTPNGPLGSSLPVAPAALTPAAPLPQPRASAASLGCEIVGTKRGSLRDPAALRLRASRSLIETGPGMAWGDRDKTRGCGLKHSLLSNIPFYFFNIEFTTRG